MTTETKVNGSKAATVEQPKRKMPVRTATTTLEGDYEGWWFKHRINPSLGAWGDAMREVASYDQRNPATTGAVFSGMVKALKLVLIDWNFVDEEGEPLPLTDEGFYNLPIDLISLVFQKANESTADAPLVSSSS